MITFDDFAKIELRVGTVITAEAVEGSEKLLKLQVDLHEDTPRQILAGIKKWYKPISLIGKQIVVVANLEPRSMMGLTSYGMVLAVGGDKPVLVKPYKKVSNGSRLG